MDELPIACSRGALQPRDLERQRMLWRRVIEDSVGHEELEEGYRFELPAERLAEAAELMAIERRCCGFLELRLEAHAFEPHVWLTLHGPPGAKRILDVELELMLGRRPR